MNSSPSLDCIRPSRTRSLPKPTVSRMSACWKAVLAEAMVRTTAWKCPSPGVVVSTNHVLDSLRPSIVTWRAPRGSPRSTDGDRALVDDGRGGVHEHSALHLDHGRPLGAEPHDQGVGRDLRLE